MTFEMKMVGSLALGMLIACDRGSVGEYEDDTGGASSGASSSGDESTQSTGTASAGSATASSATVTSTSGGAETSDDSSGSSGVAAACEGNENHLCSDPVDCGESCGSLGSMFDDSGCVRAPCSTHANCGDGMFCYRPFDYGGCQSSDVGCVEDLDGTCHCASSPDCGGAYCVPEDIVFGGATLGPSDGLATSECGPDDGPAFVLRVGTYISDACGGEFAEAPLVEFRVAAALGTTGTFTTEGVDLIAASYDAGGLEPQPVQWAVLSVAEAGDLLEGEYAVTLADDTVLYGVFSVVACPVTLPPCG